MNTRDLQYLVAVVEQRSFSRAAERVGASQPTLSAQIKKLEEMLGVSLLERNNKSVIPTPIGEQVATVAKRLLLDVELIEDIASAATSPLSGSFKLGAFPTVSAFVFKTCVDVINSQLPELRPVLVEEKSDVLVDMLLSGKLDAVFIALPFEDPKLSCLKLFDDDLLVAVSESHPLSGDVCIDDVLKYKLLVFEHGHCLRDQVSDFCRLVGLETEGEFEANSIEALKQMVRAGTGVSLIPRLAINDADEGLRYLNFKDCSPKREIGLLTRKTSLRSEVNDVLKSKLPVAFSR